MNVMLFSMLDVLFLSFFVAVISEIADKTQLVILGLALKFKSPLRVFLGALCAHAAMDGIAVVLGQWVGFALPAKLVSGGVGIVFLWLGIQELFKAFRVQTRKKHAAKGPAFIASFLTVFASEFGDKSQIAAGLLAAEFLTPFVILAGVVLGLALAIGITVFLGVRLAEKIPPAIVRAMTSLLFLVYGLVMFWIAFL